MKNMKKIASLMLALIMAVAMLLPTSAVKAEGQKGSITIESPKDGVTYTAYKIFDVTYSEGATAADDKYAYSIDGNSAWFSAIAQGSGTTVSSKIAGLELKKVADSNRYTVTKTSGFSAAAFAKTLADFTPKPTGGIPFANDTVDGKTVKKASNLDLGYYFVDATEGLCSLTTTNPDATVKEKNDIPFTKSDDKESVEIGEIVEYDVRSKMPDATQFDTYDYVISDSMSNGLTYQNDVSVTIGTSITVPTKQSTADPDEPIYTLEDNPYFTYTKNANGFTMTFKVKECEAAGMNLAGSQIVLKYTAKVNENAVATVEKNTATLTYSNDPKDSTKHTTITEEETVYSAKVVIDKYANGVETNKLAGATFVLRKQDSESNVLYYHYDTTTNEVKWVATLDEADKMVTDDKGAATFKGLKDGNYALQEIAAPEGYNLLDHMVTVAIAGSNTDTTKLTSTKQIENNSGTLIPSTGGIGTTIFYVLGTILLLGAGVLLVAKRRMNAERR